MKLNNQQLNAVSEKINKDIKDRQEQLIKEYENTHTFLTLFEKTVKKYEPVISLLKTGLVRSVQIDFEEGYGYRNTSSEEECIQKIKSYLIEQYKNKNIISISNKEIYNELILASIQSSDLETLISKVTSKFLK